MSSEYKVGDKFIIEIGHGTADPLYGARYFIKGFSTLVFDDYGLDCLEQVNGGPTLRNAYDEGFERGLEEGRNEKDCKACMDADAKANADYNSGYEAGMQRAWECARRIANLDTGEKYAWFGLCYTNSVFETFSASVAEKRIAEYEAKQAEIKVGDEIISGGDKGVVTRANNRGGEWSVIWFDGSVSEVFEKKFPKKTGRHYDITRILEQMKGADDE